MRASSTRSEPPARPAFNQGLPLQAKPWRSRRSWLAAALAFLLGPLTPAQAGSLFDLALPSLSGPETIELADYRGRFLLLTFFEPDCGWCLRQLRALESLQGRCGDGLQPLAAGVRGRDLALRKELRRARVTFPAGRASGELLALVGEVPATPWTLLLGPAGEVVATLRGFVREEQLAAAFPTLCDGAPRSG